MARTQNKEPIITAASGATCPYSGEWQVIGLVTTSILMSKGDTMPDYLGKAVLWQLILKG